MTCTETQDKLARGEALDDGERDHALSCAACGAVAAGCALLDATLAELEPPVPDGFADRVMASIAREVEERRLALERAAPTRWYERRWAGVLLSSAAALVAIANVARFVACVLLPVGSFGGAP
ncbi:MAG TPA: hypothetical protein VGQ57_11100 [Polyangiaceae bacterium]|jgi:hypothetical protein|nr:hypothetical protein [Polyangiaceae bacterium]